MAVPLVLNRPLIVTAAPSWDADRYTSAVAEARRFVAQAEKALAGQPSPHTFPVETQRAMNASMASPPVDRAKDGVVNGVPVRILLPEHGAATGVYLHIH